MEALAKTPGSAGYKEASLDRVEVSDMADQVLQLMDIETRQRTAHVSHIRSAYQAGSYQEDPVSIARGLMQEAFVDKADVISYCGQE